MWHAQTVGAHTCRYDEGAAGLGRSSDQGQIVDVAGADLDEGHRYRVQEF